MVKYGNSVDLVFYSLSHPVRREILELLQGNVLVVTELAKKFQMSLVAVSKHIKVLEKAGLVKRSREGRLHKISVEKDALLSAEQWLTEYRAFWNSQLDKLENFLEKKG